MMIYNKWGDSLTIRASCGQHKPKGFRAPVNLVAVNFTEDDREAFQFVEFLRADNGCDEIEQALKQARVVLLPRDILRRAIEEAS